MRNTSRKININKTSFAGSLNVCLKLRDTDELVKEVNPYDDTSKYYREVYLYKTLIFSDKDECRLYVGDWHTHTTVTALNTILAEINLGDLKVKSVKGELLLVRTNGDRLSFFDGINPRSIYKQGGDNE